jgi:hypothetical protein
MIRGTSARHSKGERLASQPLWSQCSGLRLLFALVGILLLILSCSGVSAASMLDTDLSLSDETDFNDGSLGDSRQCERQCESGSVFSISLDALFVNGLTPFAFSSDKLALPESTYKDEIDHPPCNSLMNR